MIETQLEHLKSTFAFEDCLERGLSAGDLHERTTLDQAEGEVVGSEILLARNFSFETSSQGPDQALNVTSQVVLRRSRKQ